MDMKRKWVMLVWAVVMGAGLAATPIYATCVPAEFCRVSGNQPVTVQEGACESIFGVRVINTSTARTACHQCNLEGSKNFMMVESEHQCGVLHSHALLKDLSKKQMEQIEAWMKPVKDLSKCAKKQVRRCNIKLDGKYDFTVDIPRSVCRKIANAKSKKKVHKKKAKKAGECEICSGIRKDKDQNDDSNWIAVPKGTCATIKKGMGIIK